MKLNISLKKSWTLIILFAALIPVLLVISWHGISTYKLQLNSTLTIEEQINRSLKIEIESEIKRYKTLLINKSDPLEILLNKPNTSQRSREINKLLRLLVTREAAIHEAIILSPQADVIAIFDIDAELTANTILTAEQRRHAKQHWELDGNYDYPEIVIPALGREYIGAPSEHGGIISFSMAVAIGENPVKGILIVRINVDNLWQDPLLIETHKIQQNITRNYMIDRRGVLLNHVKDSPYKQNDLITHIEITRYALINRSWPSDQPYIGINNQLVYGSLTIIPSLNWGLISEISRDEVTGPILISLLNIILPMLIALAVFIWFVLKLANKTLLPIHQSCAAIDRVAQGDYKTSLKLTGIHEFDLMMTGINRMMKARETAETELLHQEKEQRQMLNSMVNAVISINGTGSILSFNTAAEILFGYHADEVLGTNLNKLMPNPYASAHDDYLRRYLKTGEAHVIGFSRDVEGQRKDNSVFPLRLLVAKLPDDANGGKRFIGSCIDLTHAKQQEEQLRRSQKMDALGKLTGGIAHDYNNMLGIIMGYARLLERALSNDKKLSSYAQEIHQAGERGEKLTRKLLNFSRKQSSDDKVINLNALLRDEQNMLEKSLTARIKLVLDLEEDLWSMYLDAGDLEDAILNISINAMHAINGHGQLTIQTKNEYINEFDTQSFNLTAGDYVSLSITDTGIGMDEQTRDKIFEPFYSTKGDQGTGLGLSQVYGFVQRSRGAIKVYSELGHGSRFTLYFPRHTSSNNDTQSSIIENTDGAGGTETILLVDDEPALLNLNAELLTQQGYKTLYANSAQQALEILAQQHVDVLLSDVIMPEMDGYQLANAVKKKYPDIKIQLASGFSDNHNSELVDKKLHENMLNKPFNSQMLLERIRALLDDE